MSQPNLNEDLNIVANSNLEITMLDGDLNIIQALEDEPNDVGGLTSAELKAKFDEGPNKIKTYINETLIPEILTEEATEAARAAAEAQRDANENQRIENENARIAAEQARTTAESARADAETERAAAESARNTAEQAREAAEQARADETAGIVAQATEQAVIASNAASEASSSASGASTSASAAAASASSASDSASASASSAAAAQASAAEALSSKNSAKSEADRAKSEADRAAEIAGGDFVKSSEKGAANGVATLGADALLAASQRPKAGGLYRDDGTTTVEASLEEISTTLQNKADLVEGKVPTSQIPPHSHDGADITTGLDVLATAMGASRIVAGSYVGTGNAGSYNPCSFTFSFKPILVFVMASVKEGGPSYDSHSSDYSNLVFNIEGLTSSYKPKGYNYIGGSSSAGTDNQAKFDDTTNTLYWYYNSSSYPEYQANYSGITNIVIAIG